MKAIDITIMINDRMTMFPDPRYHQPKLEFINTPETDPRMGRYSSQLTIHAHCGTHLDTPKHMNYSPEKTIDNIPMDVLVGEAIVIKLDHCNPGPVTADILKEKMPKGVETKGKRLLVFSGYNDTPFWGKTTYFENAPYFTGDAAQWILDSGFVLLGSDVMSDNIKAPQPIVHQILLSKDVYLLEYVCNAAAVTEDRVLLVVAPTKTEGAESATTRAYVIEGVL